MVWFTSLYRSLDEYSFAMRFLLILNQSLEAIRSNLFRAGVTIFIIALGITALIIVMTAIEGIKTGMTSSFASLGSNTFSIQNRAAQVMMHGRGRDKQNFPDITYREAQEFQAEFDAVAISSLSVSGGGTFQIRYQDQETNPNINITGIDENYFITARYELEEGRNLSSDDIALARNVIIIGYELKEKLFPYSSPIGQQIMTKGHAYTVIGVLKSFGTMGMGGADRTCFLPISTLRNHYPGSRSITLSVFVKDANLLDPYMAEARGAFRLVRGLGAKEEDNFALSRSDQFVDQVLEQASVLTISAQIIAMITLLGAAVALLNVMLVSVTERTREIGLRKATGATRKSIMTQFLGEAVVICQLGGILGIVLGVLGGNLVSSFAFKAQFVIPWPWVWIGVISCFVVGIGAGIYPAGKAANLDPIESLRHA